ncbi:ABC transporter [Dactylonectria macrodidyma]|uniref:ABC transporter n=1 Tax=Dactylonectria macrodidyma TaxID=307937 RepID=A0A9P9JFK9_9HYPO|nr:ABC transporter [Dactylonectria macrodidyma]
MDEFNISQATNSTCLPAWDHSFGPRVKKSCRSFDFTLKFEDVIFGCIPAAVFICLLPWMVWRLLKSRPTTSVHSKLQISKLVALGGLFVTQVAFLALRAQHDSFRTGASLAADIIGLAATVGAIVLSYLDHQRSVRPSTLLSLYLSASVILSISRTRTLWLMGPSAPETAVFTAMSVLTLVVLVLESIERRSSFNVSDKSGSFKEYAPEQWSGLWVRTSFAWLVATLRLGYSKFISVNDLPLLDTQLRSAVLREKLMSTWATYDQKQRHSLLRACFRAFFFSFTSGIIPRLCLTTFTFAQPFMIETTVKYVGESSPDSTYGKGLIGAWTLVYLGLAVSTAIYQYQLFRFVTRVRGGLTALIYQRSLEIRTVDSEDITAVALMGTDVPRIVESLRAIHDTWATIIDISVAVWLLERQISIACLAPVLIAIIFITITSKISASTKREQRRWIEKVQERIRITTTMLGDMKAVKMLGLTSIMSTVIQKLRRDEIETSKGFRKLLTVRLVLSNSILNLAPVATFGVYAIIGVYWKNESLLAAQAFTSITLISLLTRPVMIFMQSFPMVLQSIGSFDRIQEYCNYYPKNPTSQENPGVVSDDSSSAISLQLLASEVSDFPQTIFPDHIVSLNGQSFSWKPPGSAILTDIDLEIASESLTVIAGPVGSGKTFLLESILGETISLSGGIRKGSESIAYCAQVPWLENTTIRKNILGSSPYDPKWYAAVKLACALGPDFAQIKHGDRATVGSKGGSLSGGQKQRIALARAVYSRCSVVFLDDTFSGMDAATVEHISRSLLGRNGLFRRYRVTVVLATHNHKLMALSDSLVVLQAGKVAETGSPRVLLGSDGYISRLGLTIVEESIEEEKTQHLAHNNSIETESGAADEFGEESDAFIEDATRKTGDSTVYKYYFRSSGWIVIGLFISSLAGWVFCFEFPTIWLKWWSETNATHPNKNVGMYMGVFVVLGVVGSLLMLSVCWLVLIKIISNTGYKLHSDLLDVTLKAPYRFFSMTDTGSLINRFSQDMELIDMELPMYVVNYASSSMSALAKLIILAIFSRYLASTVPVIGTMLYFLQRFYLQTSRQVRLLGIEAKAPLYTSFQESVDGASTIRAFGWQRQYRSRNDLLIDTSQRPEYLQYCIQQWLTFAIDIIVTVVVVILLTIVVKLNDKLDAGSVGVSLTAVVSFNTVLSRVIQMWTAMESSIGAVHRVKKFVAETESEGTGEPGVGSKIPSEWPLEGAVEFRDLVASYGPDTDPVLNGVSLSIKPAEHIAICGRSGSGKTSLILCLLEMLDAQSGTISIDSVSISSLSPSDLRSKLNVIPQDPFLLPGDVRFNMDPFGEASDANIIRALERVGLWELIKEQGLDKEMDSGSWSAGQKQLLCLARAMVRQKKVIVFDEAASNVDSHTESTIQDIIDTEFKGCTVIAIMHRLHFVTKYDRVAILDAGTLVEYDEPSKLLAGETKFRELYESHK